MSHQHGEMLPVPRGDVSLQRHQVKIEPLDEALACVVLRISHRLHVVLRVEAGIMGEHARTGMQSKRRDYVKKNAIQ